MNKEKLEKLSTEIQTNAFKFIQDDVKAQIARGLPDKGMPQKRHIAVVAAVSVEMLNSYPNPEDSEMDSDQWDRWVLRQVFLGAILNASALRQDLEGKGKKEAILQKEVAVENQYGD